MINCQSSSNDESSIARYPSPLPTLSLIIQVNKNKYK
jgi:hypothetical protein